MKKWSIIIAAGVAGLLFTDAGHDLSEAIWYFSSRPHELFHVAAIAIFGGLAALVYRRVSARPQRQIRIYGWTAAATTLTAFVGYFTFGLVSLSSLVVDSEGMGWGLLALLFQSGMAAYLWFEFYKALTTRGSP